MAMFDDGHTNTTFRVTLSDGTPVVARIYRDPRAQEIERRAMEAARAAVPVPAVLHSGRGFAVMEFVDAVTYRQFRRTASADAVARASYAVGHVLAALARVPPPAEAVDDDLSARFIAVASSPLLAERLGAELLRAARELIDKARHPVASLRGERSFIHGDFNNRNVLLASDGSVAAIVDWECAAAGSPLFDVARFLQYETPERPVREPHFSRGYRDGGGVLPDGWWEATRSINVVQQCESLADPRLPEEIAAEVRELVRGAALRRAP